MQAEPRTEQERRALAWVAKQKGFKNEADRRQAAWMISLTSWRGFLRSSLILSVFIFCSGVLPGIEHLLAVPTSEALRRLLQVAGIALLAGFGAPVCVILIAMAWYYLGGGQKNGPSKETLAWIKDGKDPPP